MRKKLWVVLLTVFPVFARGDLQWIGGGLPGGKTSPEPGGAVFDAPPQAPSSDREDFLMGHVTTCTKLVAQYPADSVNYFYLKKHDQVQYFAYFLLRPQTRLHRFRVEWRDPSGIVFAKVEREEAVGFTERLLSVGGETYQWFLVTSAVGMHRLFPESGQTALPNKPGLYTIHLFVDGIPRAVTFFYIKELEATPTPSFFATPAVTPAATKR